MQTADFDFPLPPELIAQTPATQRDQSRLLVLDRASGKISHRRFPDFIEPLTAGDVLVLNNARVIAARLRGSNARSGGQFEILLLEENARNDWWVMLRPGKRARVGTEILFGNGDARGGKLKGSELKAMVVGKNDEGHRRLQFSGVANVSDVLNDLGEIPLPP